MKRFVTISTLAILGFVVGLKAQGPTLTVTITGQELSALNWEISRRAALPVDADGGRGGRGRGFTVPANASALLYELAKPGITSIMTQKELTKNDSAVVKIKNLSPANCQDLATKLGVTVADLPCGGL